jgi:acyl carrier protein
MPRANVSLASEDDDACPICGELVIPESAVSREGGLCESCSHLLWRLRNCFGDLGVDVKLGDSIRFGSDSLDLAELMMLLGMDLKEEFGVDIPEAEIEGCGTVDDLIRLIRRYHKDET